DLGLWSAVQDFQKIFLQPSGLWVFNNSAGLISVLMNDKSRNSQDIEFLFITIRRLFIAVQSIDRELIFRKIQSMKYFHKSGKFAMAVTAPGSEKNRQSGLV